MTTTTTIETRSEFGFPQPASFYTHVEPENKPVQAQNNSYRVADGDGEEDYFDQLGAVI